MVTRWLFATRRRTLVATAFTALMFVDFVWAELLPPQAKPGGLFVAKPDWLFSGLWLHGWALISVNFAFWAYICRLGFSEMHESEGRQRLFVVGFFAGIVLWPVEWLEPEWAEPVKLITMAGLAFALCIGFSALLHAPSVVGVSGDDRGRE